MNKVIWGCRLVALLFVLTMLAHWSEPFRLLQIMYYLQAMNHAAVLLLIMSLVLLVVNITAAAGLYNMKTWGFITAYIAIIFTTLCSVIYLPFIDRLVAAQNFKTVLLITNAIVFLLVVYLHVQSGGAKKTSRRPVIKQMKPARKKKVSK
jgi:hypothetical protein